MAAAAAPIAASMQSYVDRHLFAGAVMLVATPEQILTHEAVGFMDLAARKPMAADAVFWIASQSKPITGAALMILVDEGKVKVDDPVSKYLPEFKDQWVQVETSDQRRVLARPQRPIAIRDLLTHTSGLPAKSAVEHPTNDLFPLATRVRSYSMLPLGSEPGAKYLYSNAGINTVGRIVEVVSGMPFERFIDERILRPLRMVDTTFWPNGAQLARLAKAYTTANGGLAEQEIDQLHYPLDSRERQAFPAGGLFSTARDLLNFYRMLVAGGVFEGHRVLSASAVKQMTSLQTEGPNHYGYGIGADEKFFGHSGAYGTNSRYDRRTGLITIFLVQQARWESGGEKAVADFQRTATAAFAKNAAEPVATVEGASLPLDPALQPAAVTENPGSDYKLAERAFQGIPGLARAPAGRLWATWYGGGGDEGPENYVMLATSADDGRTWSQITRVIDPPGLLRTYDPGLWIDPQGRLWWFYMQSYGFWDGRAGVWAITTDEPEKAAPRWSVPRRLVDGIMMNKPTALKNGDWLFQVSIWADEPAKNLPPIDRKYVPPEQWHWNAANVGAHVYRSTDRGQTFTDIAKVKTAEPSPDEHMVVERKDGSLWMLLRHRGGMAESVSRDGGKSWSSPVQSGIPHAISRFFIRRLRSGNLLLVKHNSPDIDPGWMKGVPAGKVKQGRSHLTAYLSKDDGATWNGGLLLDERTTVSYPDGDQATDGRIFVIYDFNRKAERQILVATFTEEDVFAGKIVDPNSHLRLLVNAAGPTK